MERIEVKVFNNIQINKIYSKRSKIYCLSKIKIDCQHEYFASRSESKEYLEEKIKPFDWTFTTDYMGTMSNFAVEETDERIDIEKLKRKDKILFYVDLTLFEDELHDNGIAACSIKMVL